jgi:hypothetical protein
LAKTPTLYDEFTYQGFWWFPDNPTKKWAGTVTYKPIEGISLHLYTESEEDLLLHDDIWEVPIIHGHTIQSDQTTLFSCVRGEHHSNPSLRIAHVTYFAELAVLGQCYSSFEEIQFASLFVEYSNLREWMQTIVPFDVDRRFRDGLVSYEAQYKGGKTIENHIKKIDTTIICKLWLSGNFGLVHNLNLEEKAYIQIRPDLPQTADWFFNLTDSLRNLLAILAGTPIYRQDMQAISTEKDEDGHDKLVKIYYRPDHTQNDLAKVPNMLFSVKNLQDNLSIAFQAWFDKQDSIQALSDLSLGVLYNAHRFWKFEFLALIQALESYHQVIDPQFKQKTKYELIERLSILFTGLPDHLKAFVGFDEDYLKKINTTRNYYTHYNPNKRDQALKDEQLYDAIIRLIRFVVILMFLELGIPDQGIREALLRNRRYGVWGRSELYF